ncbi:MAG: M67 family metallopeptidase, partial [Myxococcota bacterium]
TFPEECCGAMLGRDRDDGVREVVEILEIDNTKDENRERRFLIDPREVLGAEKSAREKGLDVVGIYHSHPNHPSLPSDFDRDHAMPFWSYVIVSCMDGKAATMQSWTLREDRTQFDEEELIG